MKNYNLSTTEITKKVATISNQFEQNNSELKKQYIIKNINIINNIMSTINGYKGSFGTGYPFYALNNLEGQLPIIEEQIRYNNELIIESQENNQANWECANCLAKYGSKMPDLKQVCIPCLKINNNLKPRKIINRLPDIDMWMICEDEYVDIAKKQLKEAFDNHNMHTSDIDPLKTIEDLSEIINDLNNDIMPTKMLPLDIHIIEYSKIQFLLEEIPYTLQQSFTDNTLPYLPILPLSLRKKWQHDDVAYNFVLDYLFSLTPFNWDNSLQYQLNKSRTIIKEHFTDIQLYSILTSIAPLSVQRRLETEELKNNYKKRVISWKK